MSTFFSLYINPEDKLNLTYTQQNHNMNQQSSNEN